jgi:2-oxoglutarate ferredoxin oxidoreductase subunit alpha
MQEELNIRITGEAGQGMNTIGAVISKLYKETGHYIFSHLDYMSRIRGGNNFYQIRVSKQPVYCPREKVDILIPLTAEAMDLHRDNLNKNGMVVVDRDKFEIEDCSDFFCISFYQLANEAGGSDIYVNSVCTGILAALTGIKLEAVLKVISRIFAGKGDEIVSNNVKSAELGFNNTMEKFTSDRFKLPETEEVPGYLLNGNQAIGLGAIAAGCKFYSAYPMSPSTGVMNTVAQYSEQYGIIVEQAEDEIAAVNMVIGASACGVRSMVSTSGGGFALMGEGISLAGMTETPLVIGNMQRPGPATGFPTRTEQADLNLVLGAGHGEFARVVYAPGTIEESFYLTKRAFNISEKHQIPVIILSDQFLADSSRNVDKFDFDKEPVTRDYLSNGKSQKIRDYKRYRLTSSGISPRAIFSLIDDPIYIDSDEHTEEGHITEEGKIRTDMVNKRFHKKMEALSKESLEPNVFNLDEADTIFFCFGSVFGPLQESLKQLKNKRLAMIHFPQVFPLDQDKILALSEKAKTFYTVENNAEGQLAKLLRRETGIKVNDSILQYDGRPFTLDNLVGKITAIINQ